MKIVEVPTLETLTKRELEVLHLMGEGLTAAEIAEQRSVTLNTVRSQIKSVLEKLHVGTQLKAVAILHREQNKHLCYRCKRIMGVPLAI